MTKTVSASPVRPLPIAAGRFGERSLADRLGAKAHRPADCPSIEEFEARMRAGNDPHDHDRAA